METGEVLEHVAQENIHFVRFLYCDNGGIIRGKSAYYPTLAARLVSGIGLSVAMQAMNSLDQLQTIKGMGPVGEIRLVPDLNTFRILPYAPHTAQVLTVMTDLLGNPWDACPRSFLNRMDDKAKSLGLICQASIENEFSIISPDGAPWDNTLCFSAAGMLLAQDFVHDLSEALKAQGIVLEQYYPELGAGQHEISVRHRPIMEAASEQIYIRETIRAVAHSHHLSVSFAPKPWLDQAGNGGHIHFSAVDSLGNNLFYDSDDAYYMSSLGYQFIAGILHHLPALLALSAPTMNSYQRLAPDSWSSSYVCWGPDNREAAVRIASPIRTQLSQSVNVEFKPADLTANPYLALGALIAAGLDGIERALDPGEPVLSNPTLLSEHEREAKGIARLPESLPEALDALDKDSVLLKAMGPALAESYLAVKRSEADFYQGKSPEDIAAWHRLRY